MILISDDPVYTAFARQRRRRLYRPGTSSVSHLTLSCLYPPYTEEKTRVVHTWLVFALHFCRHGVGVTKPISSVPLFSEFFSVIKTHVTYWISRLYSTGAVAPVKYKCDSNNLRGTFARTKILLTEKITNGALVTPIPGRQSPVNPTIGM